MRHPGKHLFIGTRCRRVATTADAVEPNCGAYLINLKGGVAPHTRITGKPRVVARDQRSQTGRLDGQFFGVYPAEPPRIPAANNENALIAENASPT
jgi:hypothetical protein